MNNILKNQRGSSAKNSFFPKNHRGYLQISFTWLFAIIAGVFILFLTIYGITKLIKTEQTIQDAKTGEEIGILLNPLETSFETGISTSFTLPVETRIYNTCDNKGVFGNQRIQISQKSFSKWTKTDINARFHNKYIFTENYTEGKKFYVFSKPFDFPFKVADLIYITSSLDNYCFVDAPEEIKDEISYLNQQNLFVEDCPDSENTVNICFMSGSDPDCDIIVNTVNKYVKKDQDRMYFEGDALMYAAIFADKVVYECHLKRLMQRTGHLALLYNDKAIFILQTAGCHSNLNLLGLNTLVGDLDNSKDINSITLTFIVEDIKDKNDDNSECRLW